MPDYRKKGLATYLVSELTDEILNREAIPFYIIPLNKFVFFANLFAESK